jgi:hypothetical protein
MSHFGHEAHKMSFKWVFADDFLRKCAATNGNATQRIANSSPVEPMDEATRYYHYQARTGRSCDRELEAQATRPGGSFEMGHGCPMGWELPADTTSLALASTQGMSLLCPAQSFVWCSTGGHLTIALIQRTSSAGTCKRLTVNRSNVRPN